MAWFLLVFLQYLKVSIKNNQTVQFLIEAAIKEFQDNIKFRKFCHQVLHSSLACVLQTLKPGMTKPEVRSCPNGHFWYIIYGLGPYIVDYPEQVFLTCCITGWCIKYIFFIQSTWPHYSSLWTTTDVMHTGITFDKGGERYTWEHMELLVQQLELGILWDKYGLVSDVVVSTVWSGLWSLAYTSIWIFQKKFPHFSTRVINLDNTVLITIICTAFHKWLPSSRHTWTHGTRYTPSASQGDI